MRTDYSGARVTVMGLGLHGGGLASALYFARHGARVTVTDLKTEQELAPSLERLRGLGVRLVLGRHEEEDFRAADLVVKNPGVRPSSDYLVVARRHGVRIETDISVFLAAHGGPVIAVTGTKGKSTTASAAYHILASADPRVRLGGNITVSPLEFVDEMDHEAPVILELSSWQLADLRGMSLFSPRVSVVTNIMPDHMNFYASMQDYVADKSVIFEEQSPDCHAVFNADDPFARGFHTRARVSRFAASRRAEVAGWLEGTAGFVDLDGRAEMVVPEDVRVRGRHNRLNLLAAALALRLYGMPSRSIAAAAASFPGIEHRLELFAEAHGVLFYNDSAATIPEATVQALRALTGPIHLIAGGTDKSIDFSPLADEIDRAETVHLLAGSGTEKLCALLAGRGTSYRGPYKSLADAVADAAGEARAGSSVLFSPGCASFEMFRNEFDRGRRFKEMVGRIVGGSADAARTRADGPQSSGS